MFLHRRHMFKRQRHTAPHCSHSASVPCVPLAPPLDSGHPWGMAPSRYSDSKQHRACWAHRQRPRTCRAGHPCPPEPTTCGSIREMRVQHCPPIPSIIQPHSAIQEKGRKQLLWVALLWAKGGLLSRPGRALSRWGSDSTPLIIRNFPSQCPCPPWAACSARRLPAQRSCWELLLQATAFATLRTKPLICVARSLVYFTLSFSSWTPQGGQWTWTSLAQVLECGGMHR